MDRCSCGRDRLSIASPLVKKAVCASLLVARDGWKELIRKRGWKERNMAEIEKEPTPMTPSDAGRKGGKTVWGRYGEDYYRRIGKQGGTTLKEKRGSEYYRQIARLGGQANVRKYGPDHFSEMGKKGGNTTKQRQDPDFYRRIGKIGGLSSVKKRRFQSLLVL